MVDYTAQYPSKPSWYLLLRVTESNLEPENNRSRVNWLLYMVRGNSDTPFNNSSTPYSVTGPGGVSGSFGAYRFGSSGTGTNYSSTPVGNGVLIASGGDWVTHNPNGSGSVTMRGRHEAGSTLGTADTGNRTFTLTTLTQKPGTPDDVTLAYVSDTAATLTWDNVYPSNGVPTTNQIQTSVNGAAYTQVASIAVAESLGITTAANQKITARVRATNSAGSSAYSTPSNPVFTTPAAPTNVQAVKDAALDITISWTPNVAFTEHEHVIEHSTDGGSSWSALTVVAAGTSSYKHEEPNPATTHRYRVRARNTDTAARTSAWVTSNTVQLLAAPNKPTLPVLGPYLDEAADFDLTWTHNPVDTTPQTAYEVEYSTNGGSLWSSTGKTTSAVSEHTFAGGTYAPDDALTVRVRTWGQATSGGSDGTGASPWSDPQTVTFKTRPVVTIVAPADGGTWPEADLTVQLGFSQAEGASFVRATIVLSHGATVLETKQSTTLAGTLLDTEVQNGESYTLTVTALDSNGLISDPVEADFDVSYTLPVEAGVDIIYHPDSGVAQIDLTIPDPGVGEAAAVAVTIFRTINGVRETVYAAYPVDGPTMTLLDTTPTIHGVNEYRVRTISGDGATVDVLTQLETDEDSWAFFSTGPGYATIVSFFGNLGFSVTPDRAKALVRASGRPAPIALFGTHQSLEVSGEADLLPGEGSTAQEIEAFAKTAGMVCYRDPSGNRVFGTLTVSVTHPSSLGQRMQFTVTEAS